MNSKLVQEMNSKRTAKACIMRVQRVRIGMNRFCSIIHLHVIEMFN